MVKTLTADEVRDVIVAQYDLASFKGVSYITDVINAWLRRGDGVAVYENNDLGHPEVGMKVLLSYGSLASQLNVATPPEQCPDITGHPQLFIAWRYRLVGVYRGEPLESAMPHA